MRILVIDGFTETNPVVGAAESCLGDKGHDLTTIRLLDSGFDTFMSADERRAYNEPDNLLTPETRHSVDAIRSNDALVVCTPLHEGAIAAVVKNWFERVFVPGVAFKFTSSGHVTGALTNIRRIAMVVDCPDKDRAAHARNSYTRSILRGARLQSAKSCRTTYVALLPGGDPDARLKRSFSRW